MPDGFLAVFPIRRYDRYYGNKRRCFCCSLALAGALQKSSLVVVTTFWTRSMVQHHIIIFLSGLRPALCLIVYWDHLMLPQCCLVLLRHDKRGFVSCIN